MVGLAVSGTESKEETLTITQEHQQDVIVQLPTTRNSGHDEITNAVQPYTNATTTHS